MTGDQLPVSLNTPVFGKLWARFHQQPRVTQVLRLDRSPTPEEFRTRIQPAGYPVIWPEPNVLELSVAQVLDQLKIIAGESLVKTRRASYDHAAEYATNRQIIELPWREYIEALNDQAQEGRYVGNQPFPPFNSEESDFKYFEKLKPTCISAAFLEPPAIWLGPAGSMTPLHKDSTDNFATQVIGTKCWRLFPVRDAPLLKLQRSDSALENDLAISELTESAWQHLPDAPLEVLLERGNVLYLPAGWAHAVRNETRSMMVNCWMTKQDYARVVDAW